MRRRRFSAVALATLLATSPGYGVAATTQTGSALITDRIASGEVKLSDGEYAVPPGAKSYQAQGLEALDALPQTDAPPPPPPAPPTPPAKGGKGRKKAPASAPARVAATPVTRAVPVDYRSYAQSILKRLIASKQMPAEKRTMAPPVFDIVSARNFNCVVTSQLHIACTVGAISQLIDQGTFNENMFAFALAHELSHIVLSHRNRLGREEELRSSISTLSGVAAVALLFAKSNYTRSGNTITMTATHGAANAFMYALVGGAYASHKAQLLLGPAWSKHDEDEADVMALQLMEGADFEPRAGVSFISRTQQSIDEAKKQNATFEREMQSSMIGGAILSAILSKGDIKSIAASAAFFGLDQYMEYRGDVMHHDAKARSANMAAIIDKYYPEAPDVALFAVAASDGPSTAVAPPSAGQRSVVLAVQHGEHEDEVRRTFMSKGAAAAAAICGAATAVNGEREICGVAFLISGRVAEGHRLVEPVLVDDASPPEYFDEIALANAQANDRDGALAALDAGALKYPDGRFYPSRMHILHDLGDTDGVKQTMTECQAKASSTNKLACSQLNAAYLQAAGAKLGGQ